MRKLGLAILFSALLATAALAQTPPPFRTVQSTPDPTGPLGLLTNLGGGQEIDLINGPSTASDSFKFWQTGLNNTRTLLLDINTTGITVSGSVVATGGITVGGAIKLPAIVAPATPAAGFGNVYEDSTNKVLAIKNDAGVVSSTVVPSSGGANQFATGISAAGVISYALVQPGGLSGQAQYNNAGTFGGITNLTSNGTNPLLIAIAAPVTPVAGTGVIYEDSTNKVLAIKNDAGTVSSTVTPATGSANQFATGVSAAGVLSFAQPTYSNLSGAIGSSGQIPFNNAGTEAGISGSAVSVLNDVTLAGGTVSTSDPILNLSQTWNAPTIATTGASGTGTVATITFSAQTTPIVVGSFIAVAGVTPAGYNTTNVQVTASTTTSVSYANTTTGAQTVAGTVQPLPEGLHLNITDTSSPGINTVISRPGSMLIDLQVNGNPTFGITKEGIIAASGGSFFGIQSSTPSNNGAFFGQFNNSWTGGPSGATAAIGSLNGPGFFVEIAQTATFGWSSLNNALSSSEDTALNRRAAGVVGFDTATIGLGANGWFNYGGQTRVASNVTFTSTTTLGTVTGLSVNVAAGRNYKFTAELSWTDAAAGGIQAAIAGTATATNIVYDGWIIDSGANGIKGNAQATALGTAVANAATTGTAGHLTIEGLITVNAAGTLLVQAAQSVSNATATTIKQGSTFIVQDMP